MFLDNKYTKWYYNIVNHRKQNLAEGYTERHHIIPRCMGGKNDADNLVALSAREHFICHLLLVKMVDGKFKNKLMYALNRMLSSNNDMQRYHPNSRVYKMIRENVSRLMKEKWTDNSFMENHKIRSSKRWENPEYREKMKETTKKTSKKLWADPKFRKMQSEKSSITSKKMWEDSEFKEKQRKERIDRWKNSEYKEKMSDKAKNRSKTPEGKKHIVEMSKKGNDARRVLLQNDPKFRERAIENALSMNDKIWKDPKFRQRKADDLSKIAKKLWEDPKHREKMKEKSKRPEVREKLRIHANKTQFCEHCKKMVKNASFYQSHGKKCKFKATNTLEDFFA